MTDDLAPAAGCLRGAFYGLLIWAASITLGVGIYLCCWKAIP